MTGLPSTIRAFYTPADDMYVIDYEEAVVSSDGANLNPISWHWGMFTHGVCSDVNDQNHFLWSRVGITGRATALLVRESGVSSPRVWRANGAPSPFPSPAAGEGCI